MVQKHITVSMFTSVAVAGILIMTILAATANAQESNNTGNPQQLVAGCGPGTDNSTCSTTPNPQAPAAPTAGCGPGTDNSTCSTTPNQQPAAAPTAGCGPGTDNSTCKAITPSLQPTNITKPTNNTGNVSADFVNTILSMHNSERAAVGVPALVWSDDLAAQAKTWAEHLAATGQFGHDPNRGTVGENLAGYFTGVGQGVQDWINEKKDYHGGVLTPENWSPSGHYTQMVWRGTTQIGCGTAPPNGQPSPAGLAFSVLVCRYSPPGNYMGQKPY
jgi:uncharacterized protein YkwD